MAIVVSGQRRPLRAESWAVAHYRRLIRLLRRLKAVVLQKHAELLLEADVPKRAKDFVGLVAARGYSKSYAYAEGGLCRAILGSAHV